MRISLLAVGIALLSQVPSEVGQGAGWVGTGLLGAVLSWLLGVYLPSKDKQLERLLENQDKLIEKLLAAHGKAMEDKDIRHEKLMVEQRTDFRNSLVNVVNHCEREIERLIRGSISRKKNNNPDTLIDNGEKQG